MTISSESVRFAALSVALPSDIQQPSLKQLAERLQAQQLQRITSPAKARTACFSQRTRILEALCQSPIANASVLVAITQETRPKLLLTRRAAHLNSHAGEVSCAGGKHDATDANNVVTALREAYEETMLPPDKVQLLGQLPMQTSKSGLSVRPIVALIAPNLTLIPEDEEIARIFWADFETLITEPTIEYALEYEASDSLLGQKTTLLTPSWQIDNETVWGLTGRIIASLLEVGFDRQFDWYYRVHQAK